MSDAKMLNIIQKPVWQKGLKDVVNIPGDGNCLFYAVVQQITGNYLTG